MGKENSLSPEVLRLEGTKTPKTSEVSEKEMQHASVRGERGQVSPKHWLWESHLCGENDKGLGMKDFTKFSQYKK